MQLRQASRKQTKIKILLSGPSGSGKTYSSLLLANGLADWEKIVLIDTERGSGDLYCDLGKYNILSVTPPFTPERYIEAMDICTDEGMEVIILDSITHEWDGVGGILEQHRNMAGNSYINWNKLTPRHNKFIDKILQSDCHIICCGRAKQDYVLIDSNGKSIPQKVGMKTITREGFDYEVTLSFDLDIKHYATATKDRTKLFIDKPPFIISQETGQNLLNWGNEGITQEEELKDVLISVPDIKNVKELEDFWRINLKHQTNNAFKKAISNRKKELSKI